MISYSSFLLPGGVPFSGHNLVFVPPLITHSMSCRYQAEVLRRKEDIMMASLQSLHSKMDQQEKRLEQMETVLSEKTSESVINIPPVKFEHDFLVIQSYVSKHHATTWSEVWKVGQGRPQFEAGVRFYNSTFWRKMAVCLKCSRNKGISGTEVLVKVKVTAVSSRGREWNVEWKKDVPKLGYFSHLMWVTGYLSLSEMEENGFFENETLRLRFEFWVF
ncbi:uncharacterized protein LOC101864505 [Aplysia californica]|uniref:Uncharacterized protein LOC101864505 n=1 Tax=Aplysia californica TaxID=6500 RepID=A0ABM0KAY3_APLCA|nr:uncharacterized protein LOC101864505 [Aplysia californica]